MTTQGFAALAAAAIGEVFAHVGDPAVLVRGALAWPVRVVLSEPREGVTFGSGRDLVRDRRTAELPAADVRPQAGDTLTLFGAAWKIAGAPKLSSDAQVWLLDLVAADTAPRPTSPPPPAVD